MRRDHYGHCLRVYSKPVYRFFKDVLGISVGEIPAIVDFMDPVNRQYFLRGVFDAEGDVDANYTRSRVRISQASRKFLIKLISLFNKSGISVNGPYGPFYKYPTEEWNVFSKWYYLEIRKKSEILRFIEKVGSSHLNKAPRLESLSRDILNKYKPHTS